MIRLNVRCCCQPQKILGTYQVSEVMRRWIAVPLMTDDGVRIEKLEVRDFYDYSSGERKLERAIYSDDRPLEFWRQLPGFADATVETD